MSRPTVNSIWIGAKLGPVHAACLRSFVRHGHRTVLHVYEQPPDVPDGVELSDANDLLPGSRLMYHSVSGSPAIFSDFLRYEIMHQGRGLYVDCDCYCVRPIEDADYIFGYEAADFINGAVLKLPRDCPVLDDLRSLRDSRGWIPPWAGVKRQMYYRWRARLGMPIPIYDMPWGYAGPHALTWYLKRYGLHRHSAPIDVYYPVAITYTSLFFDAGLKIEDLTTPRTRVIHLWNERLKQHKMWELPKLSPLGRIMSSG